MDTIAVITGPTASGKTALAVQMALRLGGEVVSADSMQVYRGMDIGTAKPTAAEAQGVPHHMLDVADPGEGYSVSRYQEEATICVRDIIARGRVPIICGGTGQYIDALVKGTGFLPAGDDTLRRQLEDQWQSLGPEAMLNRLGRFDPQSARRLHINDKKRIIRAIEVYLLSGVTITQHNQNTRAMPPRFAAKTIALCTDPREVLYARIRHRVDQMLAQGLEAEARALYDTGRLCGTAAQAIGYKELIDAFEGRATLQEAAQVIKQRSCNYAKRQLTWLRPRQDVKWITLNHPAEKERALSEATNFLCPLA